jgi:hypothetical protein
MSWILNWMDQVWCVHSRSSGFLLYLVCREKLSGKKQLNVGWQFITKCNIFLKLSGWICEQNGVVDLQSKVQQMRFTFDRSIKSSPIATSATFFAAQQAAKWVIEFTCGGNPPCIIRILEIGYNFAFSCHSNLKNIITYVVGNGHFTVACIISYLVVTVLCIHINSHIVICIVNHRAVDLGLD